MSRISSSSAIVAAVCIALALPACKGKSPSKKQAAASETGTKPHKLTPREEQQQVIEGHAEEVADDDAAALREELEALRRRHELK